MTEEDKEVFVGLTKSLLLALMGGLVITAIIAAPGIGYVLREIQKDQFRKAHKKGKFVATIKRLEKQKWVSWKQEGENLVLTLTEDGRRKIIQYDLDNLQLKKSQRWDGSFRIVIFDIPNTKKMAREILRNKLKELEFYQLQESVFVTPFECKDEIDFLRHTLEISPYVNYILAKEISNINLDIWFSKELKV